MSNPPSLRELCAKATPSPWVIAPNALSQQEQSSPLKLAIQNPSAHPDVCRFLDVPHADANAQLIARLSPEVMVRVYDIALEIAQDGFADLGVRRSMMLIASLLDGLGGAEEGKGKSGPGGVYSKQPSRLLTAVIPSHEQQWRTSEQRG